MDVIFMCTKISKTRHVTSETFMQTSLSIPLNSSKSPSKKYLLEVLDPVQTIFNRRPEQGPSNRPSMVNLWQFQKGPQEVAAKASLGDVYGTFPEMSHICLGNATLNAIFPPGKCLQGVSWIALISSTASLMDVSIKCPEIVPQTWHVTLTLSYRHPSQFHQNLLTRKGLQVYLTDLLDF
uniref:Uncharacterized protein n=1 Tax=Bracon brevicornis TaxID=1563983 RepID=A0A6V7LZQ3_9HYME